MALNALLFSKSPETAKLPAAAVDDLGIRVEVCSDIFSAIKIGTQQSFACLIIDWSDRPEAGFLLKRARESAANRNTVVIAIVDRVPSPVEAQENRLDFFIHRPIAVDEVREVLTNACQRMKEQMQAASDIELVGPLEKFETGLPFNESKGPRVDSAAEEAPQFELREPLFESEVLPEKKSAGEPKIDRAEDEARQGIGLRRALRPVCAAVLALAAVVCVWRSHKPILYLVHSHEGTFRALRQSVTALLSTRRSVAQPVKLPIADEQQDAYFSRPSQNTSGNLPLALIPAEIDLPEGSVRLPKACNFPLPRPELMRSDPPPLQARHPEVPESLKGAAPITRPVVAAVGPLQIMPVSNPPPQMPVFSEAARLSEEQARSLLVQSVDPVYPPEAAAKNVQGPVVLQAVIARDGSVEDLKIVRGYFVLGRAAVAAVKQWRFKPYILNGHPAKAQTLLTLDVRPLPN